MTENQRMFQAHETVAFMDLMCGFRDDSDDPRDAELSDEAICRKYDVRFYQRADGRWAATWDGAAYPLILDPDDGWIA